jgi:hypothetical protein
VTFDLLRWFGDVSGKHWIWYARYLSANDTGATGANQVGLYLPKFVFGTLFPTAASSTQLNPSVTFPSTVEREGVTRAVRAIWYNNRTLGRGTRNECRITGWGGRASPLQDSEATGSLVVFAFRLGATGDTEECRVWVCSDLVEEEIVLDWIGLVEPGAGTLISAAGQQLPDVRISEQDQPCALAIEQLPGTWLQVFPEAAELVSASVTRLPTVRALSPDERLVRRRDCEYSLFRAVEEAFTLPRVRQGFATVDSFIAFAGAVTNRRKARSGRSLELQAVQILQEESIQYSHGEVSERGKRPDFIFPSIQRYQEPSWSTDRLRMLAAKTTCKDRWRQVIDEADRIPVKHLLTLQQGVSEMQFDQMEAARVRLVVPHSLHRSYPEAVRPRLLTLSGFLSEAAALNS